MASSTPSDNPESIVRAEMMLEEQLLALGATMAAPTPWVRALFERSRYARLDCEHLREAGSLAVPLYYYPLTDGMVCARCIVEPDEVCVRCGKPAVRAFAVCWSITVLALTLCEEHAAEIPQDPE